MLQIRNKWKEQQVHLAKNTTQEQRSRAAAAAATRKVFPKDKRSFFLSVHIATEGH